MKKKIFISVFLLLILIANLSFASYSTVSMSVVEEPICTIPIGENSKFEKKLISKDLNNKEVTLQLQVTNEEIADKPTGEVMLVLDNSDSMTSEIADGKTRKDFIFDSAKTLITNLLKDNESLKIGIVSFSTNYPTSEGTIDDAKLESGLSSDATILKNAISNIQLRGDRTNLESGLALASQQFTKSDNNKYLIVLTDGVPNVAIDDTNFYSDSVITKTKEKIIDIDAQKIKLLTMLTGITNESEIPKGGTTSKTYGEIITEIFGTTENPTAGDFYYITDDKIETTVTNDIYNSLLPNEKTLKDIKIVDYFPKEIVDNFDFAYVTKANIGEISAEIDKTNHSITWTIPELASGQTATVQYKLKLKENFDSNIVDKILNTNEKVDITYKDLDGKEQAKTSDVSPKLKLTEPPKVLPKAGITTLLITFAVLATGLLIFSLAKLTIIHHKMK